MAGDINYLNAPNRFVTVGDVKYAYRKLGKKSNYPLVMLQHFRGSMDYWDPAFIDALAKDRTVIVFDNKGVSLTGGQTPDTFAAMGDDAAKLIEALGYTKVDLLGFSIGGAAAQELTVNHPGLVRKLILAATAPKGGQYINNRDPKIIAIVTQPTLDYDGFLKTFFEPTAHSQQLGNAYVMRRKQRSKVFDKESSGQTLHAHIHARQEWGTTSDTGYSYLKKITQPVLVANGSHDIMMFTINSYTLYQHLPNAKLLLYPDSGHGFLFQYPEDFAAQVNIFLNQ